MNPGRHDPNSTACILAGANRRVTYGELESTSNSIAHLFGDLGVVKGDGIVICMANHASFLPVCWAALRAGLSCTPMSYRLQSREVEHIVNDCGAKFEYLHDEEKTKTSQSAHGWTRLGDIGYLDEDVLISRPQVPQEH